MIPCSTFVARFPLPTSITAGPKFPPTLLSFFTCSNKRIAYPWLLSLLHLYFTLTSYSTFVNYFSLWLLSHFFSFQYFLVTYCTFSFLSLTSFFPLSSFSKAFSLSAISFCSYLSFYFKFHFYPSC